MASAVVKRPAQVTSSKGIVILAVLVALLVILNVVYVVFLRQTGRSLRETAA